MKRHSISLLFLFLFLPSVANANVLSFFSEARVLSVSRMVQQLGSCLSRLSEGELARYMEIWETQGIQGPRYAQRLRRVIDLERKIDPYPRQPHVLTLLGLNSLQPHSLLELRAILSEPLGKIINDPFRMQKLISLFNRSKDSSNLLARVKTAGISEDGMVLFQLASESQGEYRAITQHLSHLSVDDLIKIEQTFFGNVTRRLGNLRRFQDVIDMGNWEQAKAGMVAALTEVRWVLMRGGILKPYRDATLIEESLAEGRALLSQDEIKEMEMLLRAIESRIQTQRGAEKSLQELVRKLHSTPLSKEATSWQPPKLVQTEEDLARLLTQIRTALAEFF